MTDNMIVATARVLTAVAVSRTITVMRIHISGSRFPTGPSGIKVVQS